jgi:hypothetical protein
MRQSCRKIIRVAVLSPPLNVRGGRRGYILFLITLDRSNLIGSHLLNWWFDVIQIIDKPGMEEGSGEGHTGNSDNFFSHLVPVSALRFEVYS